MVLTVSRRMALVGDAVKITSAFSAAKRTPRAEAPAWKITGVRCGLGSHRWMPGTL